MLSPPTDSLPKFCAVLGLLVIFSANAWHLKTRREVEDSLVDQAGPSLQLQNIRQAMDDKLVELEAELQRLEKVQDPEPSAIITVKAMYEELAGLSREADGINVQIATRMAATDYAFERTKDSLFICIAATILGGIASHWGFWRWAKSEKQKVKRAAA